MLSTLWPLLSSKWQILYHLLWTPWPSMVMLYHLLCTAWPSECWHDGGSVLALPATAPSCSRRYAPCGFRGLMSDRVELLGLIELLLACMYAVMHVCLHVAMHMRTHAPLFCSRALLGKSCRGRCKSRSYESVRSRLSRKVLRRKELELAAMVATEVSCKYRLWAGQQTDRW